MNNLQKVVIVKSSAKMSNNGITQDSEALELAVTEAVATLASEGYKVVQITPIQSGHFKFEALEMKHTGIKYKGEGAYGYGCSYTSSLMILAELVNGVA